MLVQLSIVLSQITRLTDGRTDGQTDGPTDGRTDRQTSFMQRGKSRFMHIRRVNFCSNGPAHVSSDRCVVLFWHLSDWRVCFHQI